MYRLPLKHVVRLIQKAKIKKEKQKAWDMWLIKYQHMDKESFVPFSEFYRTLTQPLSTRSKEDILKDVNEIRNRARKEGE